jgi:hypothetical protein
VKIKIGTASNSGLKGTGSKEKERRGEGKGRERNLGIEEGGEKLDL